MTPKTYGESKSSLVKLMTKLQSQQTLCYLNLRKIIDKMKTNDLPTTTDQYFFLLFEKFVEIFDNYNANETKVDQLMTKFSSNLVKYSSLLTIGVDKVGVRSNHSFLETYLFTDTELALFSKIYEKFPYNQSFLATIIYIKKYRLKTLNDSTPDHVPSPPTNVLSIFSLEQIIVAPLAKEH